MLTNPLKCPCSPEGKSFTPLLEILHLIFGGSDDIAIATDRRSQQLSVECPATHFIQYISPCDMSTDTEKEISVTIYVNCIFKLISL